MVKPLLFLLSTTLLFSGTVLADEAAAPAAKAPSPPPNMESVQLVLLKRGPKWTPEQTPAIAELQKQHIAHLTRMGQEGKMLVAGPFDEQDDPAVRGVCIYRVASVAEARRLAEQDPMVRAGRLRVEAMRWWFEKGYMTFPRAPTPASTR
jgi:uncharacterized protein YciI